MNVSVALLPRAAGSSPRPSPEGEPSQKSLLGAVAEELRDLYDGVKNHPFRGDSLGFEEAQRQAEKSPLSKMTGAAILGGGLGAAAAAGATILGAPLSKDLLLGGAGAGAALAVGIKHHKELWNLDFVKEARSHPLKSLACAGSLAALGALKGPLDAVILGGIGLFIANHGVRNSARWVAQHPGFAAAGALCGGVAAMIAFAPDTGAWALAKPAAALATGVGLGATKGAWAHQKYTRAVPVEKRTAVGHLMSFGVPFVSIVGGCMLYDMVPAAMYITGKMKGGFLSGLAMEDLRRDRINAQKN